MTIKQKLTVIEELKEKQKNYDCLLVELEVKDKHIQKHLKRITVFLQGILHMLMLL